MTENFNIPLIHELYELYKLSRKDVKNFTKTEKYDLGQKIKSLIIEMMEITFDALICLKNQKIITVRKLSNKNDLLKLLIRLCYDEKIINQKEYLTFQKRLQTIGKMIGSWLKSLNKQEM